MKNKSKRIFLDIDDVLSDFGAYFLERFVGENEAPALRFDDSRFIDNMNLANNTLDFWENMPILNKPSDIKFKVSGYCTARTIEKSITESWLHKNDYPKAPVYCVYGKSKADLLLSLGCDIFIDDAVHNFLEVSGVGIETYLYTRSHNTYFSTDMRIEKLQDLLDKIV